MNAAQRRIYGGGDSDWDFEDDTTDNANPEGHNQYTQHVIDAVNKHGRGANLAKMIDVRKHLDSVGIKGKEEQDKVILEARKAYKVTGAGFEHFRGVSPGQAKAEREAGHKGPDGETIGFLSIRNTDNANPEGHNQYTIRAYHKGVLSLTPEGEFNPDHSQAIKFSSEAKAEKHLVDFWHPVLRKDESPRGVSLRGSIHVHTEPTSNANPEGINQYTSSRLVPDEVRKAGFPHWVTDPDDRDKLAERHPKELQAWREAVAKHSELETVNEKLKHRAELGNKFQALKKAWESGKPTSNAESTSTEPLSEPPGHFEEEAKVLRGHHSIKHDLILAGQELARHPLVAPGYGSIDMKNNGSGEVWWTGADTDKEGFREVVIRRLMQIPGVTKVTYRVEVPPDREGEIYGSGAPVWDEVWTSQGIETYTPGLPSLEDL